jgi:glutamate-1-semialdehyde 2,1-aminomutase
MSATTVAAPRNSDLDTAIAEAHERYSAARPKSAALHQKAKAVMPGGNTRSNLYYSPFPTAMAGGQGCQVTDIDGNTYLDLCGEYTAGLFGHSETRILEKVQAAIGRGIGLAAVGENEPKFAELVCARFPSIEKVRFTNSGTEANMMAITLARHHSKRDGILVFRGGYHGSVLTFTGGGPNAMTAPLDFIMADYNDIDGTVALMREHKDRIGTVILEPMQGSGGCIPASVPFLKAIRAECDALGMVLIYDEVMTSRHSSGGLQKLTGVHPDLTALGKYLAGGMNIGAFGGRAKIMDAFDATQPGALVHSGTFNNNVLSMAGGVVALGEIFDSAAAEAHYQKGERLRARLNEIAQKHKVTLQFTGIGSMIQAHFRTGEIVRRYTTTANEEGLLELFFFDLLEAGIYLARRGMVAMSLPVGEAECERFAQAVDAFCTTRGPLMRAA